MVNVGTHHVRMGSDNWAVYSEDGSLAAHFEHTVAITGEGPRILTPWHLTEAEPLQAATLSGRRSAGSWAPAPILCCQIRFPISRSYEGPRISQAHVREVQDHPP